MSMKTVYEALLKVMMLEEDKKGKRENKTKKGNIVCITKGLWVIPSKIVKISSSWCRK